MSPGSFDYIRTDQFVLIPNNITSTVTQHLWLSFLWCFDRFLPENSCTSKDCRFTYLLDFILKPDGKLEYEDVSLLKFKRKTECRHLPKIALEIRLFFKDLTRSKEPQPHAPVILRAWAKMTSMFVNRYL